MENLAESRKALYNTPRGSAVLRACGVDAYLRSPAAWHQSAASAAAARAQFARLFGEAPHQTTGDGAPADNGLASSGGLSEGSGSRKRKPEVGAAEAAGKGGDAAAAEPDIAAKPRKKRKKSEAAVQLSAATLGGQQTEHIMDLLGEVLKIPAASARSVSLLCCLPHCVFSGTCPPWTC